MSFDAWRNGARPVADANCSATCEQPPVEERPTGGARRAAPDRGRRRVRQPGRSARRCTHSGLGDLDRKFVTELVYGTTRMRRACDALVDRFLTSPPDAVTRTVLRLGAYQVAYAGVPPHAAVGETVGLSPKRTRGLVNAVLRKVARLSVEEMTWPSDGARLSYPDWIVDTFRAELGDDDADVALAADERRAVGDAPGRRLRAGRIVAVGRRRRRGVRRASASSTCAPRRAGSRRRWHRTVRSVIAGDQRPNRARLVRENALGLDLELPVLVADGVAPPFAAAHVRRRAARRSVLRSRGAAPPRRRPLAHPAERRRASWRCSRAGCWPPPPSSCGSAAGWSTACARSRRPSRSITRRPTGSRSTTVPPAVGHVAAVRAGLAGAPAGCRHRRHGDDSVPSHRHERADRSTGVRTGTQAKVLTVSDGVAHGVRDDASGRALVEHLGDAGFDVVDHRVTADGADLVAAALTRWPTASPA